MRFFKLLYLIKYIFLKKRIVFGIYVYYFKFLFLIFKNNFIKNTGILYFIKFLKTKILLKINIFKRFLNNIISKL